MVLNILCIFEYECFIDFEIFSEKNKDHFCARHSYDMIVQMGELWYLNFSNFESLYHTIRYIWKCIKVKN